MGESLGEDGSPTHHGEGAMSGAPGTLLGLHLWDGDPPSPQMYEYRNKWLSKMPRAMSIKTKGKAGKSIKTSGLLGAGPGERTRPVVGTLLCFLFLL